MMKMTKKVLSGTLWMARGTATMLGFAVMLAVVLGVGTAALAAAPGDPFKLGKSNSVDKITTLVGSVNKAMLKIDNNSTGDSATALNLQVKPGQAPMKVDSGTKVANLNSDLLDGKGADQIGVNGLEQVTATSATNSSSGKSAVANCPPGKVLVGTGYNTNNGKSGVFPNEETDIVIDAVFPSPTNVSVVALEEEPTSVNWSVTARAICATAP